MPANLHPRPYVYRAYNADGDLLYIGSTICLEMRLTHHAGHTRWWFQAKRWTFERHATEADARAAELAAIGSEMPRWNIRGRSPFHPDGAANSYVDILAHHPGDCRWNGHGLLAEKRAA